MRLLAASLVFALLGACSQGTPIKDLPDNNVSKKPRQWKDPGAKPDLPLDAGRAEPPGDAGESEADAGILDGGP